MDRFKSLKINGCLETRNWLHVFVFSSVKSVRREASHVWPYYVLIYLQIMLIYIIYIYTLYTDIYKYINIYIYIIYIYIYLYIYLNLKPQKFEMCVD